jgi:hypothetical protein
MNERKKDRHVELKNSSKRLGTTSALELITPPPQKILVG